MASGCSSATGCCANSILARWSCRRPCAAHSTRAVCSILARAEPPGSPAVSRLLLKYQVVGPHHLQAAQDPRLGSTAADHHLLAAAALPDDPEQIPRAA